MSRQNLLAVEDLERDFDPVDLVLVESGGDNLTATFSPALVDAQFFVLDVAGGGDVARKGGPGIARADVLIVNKTDLAPYVGVDVPQMVADAEQARDGRAVIALSRNDPASVARLVGGCWTPRPTSAAGPWFRSTRADGAALPRRRARTATPTARCTRIEPDQDHGRGRPRRTAARSAPGPAEGDRDGWVPDRSAGHHGAAAGRRRGGDRGLGRRGYAAGSVRHRRHGRLSRSRPAGRLAASGSSWPTARNCATAASRSWWPTEPTCCGRSASNSRTAAGLRLRETLILGRSGESRRSAPIRDPAPDRRRRRVARRSTSRSGRRPAAARGCSETGACWTR